jgi:putative oxidoreductase
VESGETRDLHVVRKQGPNIAWSQSPECPSGASARFAFSRHETHKEQTMQPTMQDRLQHFAPVPLRLMLGFGFLLHGYPKLFTGEGNESFAGMLSGLGVPAPGLNAYLLGGFEFFGGILLLLGVAVRVVSSLSTINMLVAAALVHWPAGFNFMNVTGVTESGQMQFGLPGYEVNLLYIAGFVSLVISGAGGFAVPVVRQMEIGRAVPDAPSEVMTAR